MAFTRANIRNLAKESGVELPKELEDSIISEYTKARDAYAEEQVKAALENNPQNEPAKVEDSEEYKTLKKEFEDYKADVAAKAENNAKESAYRKALANAGISANRIDSVIKVTDLGSIKVDKDGNLADADAIDKNIRTEWADFIGTATTTGVQTANPPANTGGGAMTKTDIMKIKDAGQRQAALAEYIKSQKGN